MSPMTLQMDPSVLEPLVGEIVDRTVARIEADRTRLGDKVCYSEEEAARLLGLKRHQLRDARLAGKVQCSQIVGRRIRYTMEDLLNYLNDNRYAPP